MAMLRVHEGECGRQILKTETSNCVDKCNNLCTLKQSLRASNIQSGEVD